MRYDISNYIDYLDYEVGKLKGQHSSYEREYYDLVRGGFLKYIMQMKIGQMQGATIAYHNTQKIFGFEYIRLQDMERRVFGCSQFSDIIFKSSLGVLEKILDYILDDHDSNHYISNSVNQDKNKIFKVGFYSSEKSKHLIIMVEIFDNDQVYQERFSELLPEYMRDPVDYYNSHNIQPQVFKYHVGIYPEHNGIPIDESPILFEQGDNLDLKMSIQRVGQVDFGEYMQFLHEAYKVQNLNIENNYSGTWSFQI
jgi:hypothetical protein